MKPFFTVPRVVFAVGTMLLLCIQIISVQVIYSGWGWNRSRFSRYIFWPLLVISIALCGSAPLFSKLPLNTRAVRAVLFGLLALAIYFGTSLVILVLYGA